MNFPDFSLEKPLWRKGYSVIGIDEVGRGAFAGPVGVGAVMFENLSQKDKEYLLSLGINDSKKLSSKRRLELSEILKQLCIYAVEFIDVKTINKVGIGKATFLGMQNVASSLIKNLQPTTYNLKPFLLVDAFEIPSLNIPQTGVKFGDSISISIASASIIAKVERDKLMEKLGLEYKSYAWDKNKGYGTLNHRKAISRLGLTNLHREVFCRNIEASLLF